MEVINYGQETLFGKKIISSVNYDEQEIIRDILFLHCDGNSIDVDCTYSSGNFYKKGLPEPKLKFDLEPKTHDTVYADCRSLPLEKESVGVMMFDPPFISRTSELDTCITSERFGSFKTMDECWKFYSDSLKAFYQVLKPNGILIFKCQDNVDNHKNYFSHVKIMMDALEVGYYPLDLFVYVAKNRMDNGTINQEHARKFHSYFWVFRKLNSKVNYKI